MGRTLYIHPTYPGGMVGWWDPLLPPPSHYPFHWWISTSVRHQFCTFINFMRERRRLGGPAPSLGKGRHEAHRALPA